MVRGLGAVVAVAGLAMWQAPACAHPHVFVDADLQLEASDDGALRKIRHEWTFDDMYSAFAVQGLPRANGAPTEAALARLAEEIVEKLEDVEFFTSAGAQGHDLQTTGAQDARAAFVDGRLRLSFTVLLRAIGGPADKVDVRVYDPQYVVAITVRDAVKIVGPARCRHALTRPGALDAADARQLDDSVRTNQLAANFGAKLATVVAFDCRP